MNIPSDIEDAKKFLEKAEYESDPKSKIRYLTDAIDIIDSYIDDLSMNTILRWPQMFFHRPAWLEDCLDQRRMNKSLVHREASMVPNNDRIFPFTEKI